MEDVGCILDCTGDGSALGTGVGSVVDGFMELIEEGIASESKDVVRCEC